MFTDGSWTQNKVAQNLCFLSVLPSPKTMKAGIKSAKAKELIALEGKCMHIFFEKYRIFTSMITKMSYEN